MTRRAWGVVLVVVLCACGGDDDGPVPDAAGDMMSGPCGRTCDDGLFCNGAETCDPDDARADDDGCVLPESPCAGACDETADACDDDCERPDLDGDGVDSIACGGADCDDSNADVFPGATEVCDPAGVDEDCDPRTLGADMDGDGFYDDECCNGAACGLDCDDSVAGINPMAVDGCGGGDEDCDGDIDEEPDSVFFRDQDDDNYGVTDDTLEACSQPPGYAARGGDCSDDPFMAPPEHPANEVNPGASEICNDFDDNCDGARDEGLSCSCDTPGEIQSCGVDPPAMDGVGICRSGTQRCQPDGTFTICAGATSPLIAEVCNGDDDDCDGRTDEGARPACFRDNDEDGYAAPGTMAEDFGCSCPPFYTDTDPMVEADCDDSSPTTYPGAPEVCDRRVNDCDDPDGGGVQADEDFDDDGHTSSSYRGCSGGFARDDCHDFDSRVRPSQDEYFGEHYCAPGECACTSGCRVRSGPSVCGPCESGPLLERYDYNCDGALTRQPPVPGCSCPGAGFACAGEGPSSSSGRCGRSVTYNRCGSGTCGSCVGAGASTTEGLGCR